MEGDKIPGQAFISTAYSQANIQGSYQAQAPETSYIPSNPLQQNLLYQPQPQYKQQPQQYQPRVEPQYQGQYQLYHQDQPQYQQQPYTQHHQPQNMQPQQQ